MFKPKLIVSNFTASTLSDAVPHKDDYSETTSSLYLPAL
jgi:hypothetical protein